MTGLRKLPDGQLYVCTGGKEFLDHRGNVYALAPATPPVSVPHVATPAAEKVTDWRADLPSVALNPASVKLVKILKEGMRTLPIEHFLAVGIDRHGGVCFEDWQEGDSQHCDVNYDRVVSEAIRSAAKGVVLAHNHPDGSAHMSEPDKRLTKQLERKLAGHRITLVEHAIVPGHPESIREAQRPVTSYDLRVRESERLWGPAGGPPPMPWGRWQSRQVEALPNEYPRDGFDVETMTNQLEEAAREILHSVPLDVAKRIVQTVAQRLGVPA